MSEFYDSIASIFDDLESAHEECLCLALSGKSYDAAQYRFQCDFITLETMLVIGGDTE